MLIKLLMKENRQVLDIQNSTPFLDDMKRDRRGFSKIVTLCVGHF